ncbi:MAG: uroporphyrinogen-III synthase [Candidatus Hydrothermarchaeota archaeon]|nr:uroporphyrinogen-III synthase [Candidatus Hydrothermarchaeota archaeon]
MKVAITRPRERAEDTIKLVEKKGWSAIIVPTVEIVPRKDSLASIDLSSYDWLVITSASGADIAGEHFGDALKKIKIACIGPKTREVLEKLGVKVALIPKEYKTEALVEELIKKAREKRILVARASAGREVLVEKLKSIAEVTEIPLYDTITTEKNASEAFSKSLEKGEIDAIIFTSSQAAKNFFRVIDRKKIETLKVCAIGPITAQTLASKGIRVDAVPKEYTVEACLDALEKLV